MLQIMLLEDDPVSAKLLQAMLTHLGYSVCWAQNGRKALELLHLGLPPDLVLTDIFMPEMDGIEAIRHLRLAIPNVPIIAMTAQAESSYLKAAEVFGAVLTLPKPISPEPLLAAINKVLHSHGHDLSKEKCSAPKS